jgi:hypothetical protein
MVFPLEIRQSSVTPINSNHSTPNSRRIDLPHSYIENIDVRLEAGVSNWPPHMKLRITTSIYSGLLRFADLNILAPNTL